MKIIILGGDGFCGWPTSLHLSDKGHDIFIVDNLSRRKIVHKIGSDSLTPISSIEARIARWEALSSKRIGYKNIDISNDYDELVPLIQAYEPDVIVHFAEQPSAPYSMKSSQTKRYTVDHNINATHNVLAAIVESGKDIHVVHLGTMGVYGYGTNGMPIPEGYVNIKLCNGDKEIDSRIMYPYNPGSVYHMTKCLDNVMFQYYVKNNKMRITDLHQGIVWGTHTIQTRMHDDLINRFDYDGDYGTVLNRFLMQAAINHPLTIHGTGGQTRAFIHIQDTVRCIELAVLNPPLRGEELKIINQVTETHRVRDLADMLSRLTGVGISYLPNPRNEAQENDLDVDNRSFINMGLNPITLEERLLEEVIETAKKYADRCNTSNIVSTALW